MSKHVSANEYIVGTSVSRYSPPDANRLLLAVDSAADSGGSHSCLLFSTMPRLKPGYLVQAEQTTHVSGTTSHANS